MLINCPSLPKMVRLLSCLVFCLLLWISNTNGRSVRQTDTEDTLELVHVLFRHGDRTPDKSVIYPNDPHINASYAPVGFGQLTNAGKRKEYLLGKALRKRYGRFLGQYNIETVDARCTDYNRTKMSLQLVLASLFPPEDDLVWERRLKWQPVPFNYWTLQDDHSLGDPYKNCPVYKDSYITYLGTEERAKKYSEFAEILKYLSKNAGDQMTTKKIQDLYFTLTIENETGLKLPQWTNPIFPTTITNLGALEYEVATATPKLKRLSSGFLVKKIVDDTRSKIEGALTTNTKMFLYSAHEYNLAYLLRFLNVYYPHIPPYGSYILIEIHNINGIRGVKVFYQDYKTSRPRRLKLPGCDNFCKFEKFVKLYGDLMPSNEKECISA